MDALGEKIRSHTAGRTKLAAFKKLSNSADRKAAVKTKSDWVVLTWMENKRTPGVFKEKCDSSWPEFKSWDFVPESGATYSDMACMTQNPMRACAHCTCN